jgi:hypothetical protein
MDWLIRQTLNAPLRDMEVWLGLDCSNALHLRLANPTNGASKIDFCGRFFSLGLIIGVPLPVCPREYYAAALTYLHSVPRAICFSVAAILFSSLGSWQIGGQYSMASVTLFLVDALSYAGTIRLGKAEPI